MFTKIGRHIGFEETLDMSAYVLADQRVDAAEHASRCAYQLYGVIEHSGGMRGGHYVAYVRRGGAWYFISDSLSRQVGVAQVLKCQAYMLFYEQQRNGGGG